MEGGRQIGAVAGKTRLARALLAGSTAIWATNALAATPDTANSSTAVLAINAASDASAEELASSTLPVVTVTARREEENIQRVPLTVTAISPGELKQQAIVNVFDLTYAAPSLTVSTTYMHLLPNFAIRGLSTGVATYFSDAPTPSGPVAATPFMDVSQIEVLNGPQGTLFGRSSAAGAILITPTHPDLNNWGGSLDGIVGDYDRLQGTAVLNAPLIPGELGLRIAVNADHVRGYTNIIGTSDYLDGVNDQQLRIGLEFKKGGFDNYVALSYVNVDQSATGNVETAYNLNPPDLGGLLLLPAELGPLTGPLVFGATCTAAKADGFTSDVTTCENQRAALLGAIAPALEAEVARVTAGGPAAVRSVPAPYNGNPQFEKERHGWVTDIAQYDFGDVGPVKLSVKDIFSFDWFAGSAAGEGADGIGGRLLDSVTDTIGPGGGVVGSNNYIGSTFVEPLSPPVDTYTNDFQIHADVANGLLTSVVGIYYSDEVIPTDLAGLGDVYGLFSGATSVDGLGFGSSAGFSTGGYVREEAVYTQETLNLARWIHGLSLTGGFRYSWDSQLYTSRASVSNFTLPGFVPGTPGTLVPGAASSSGTSSSGYNYTVQAAEQVNPDWMVYASVNRAYVPGGVNLALAQDAEGLPDFTPTYQPEIVLEEEVGTKFNVNMGGFHAQVGADIYNNDFTNIIEGLAGFGNNLAVIEYSENVAAAYLRGAEIYANIIAGPRWEFRFAYNYNEAKFTKWVASDPDVDTTNPTALPGGGFNNPSGCLPPLTTRACFINLANNPFPNMPNQQGHITVVYHAPIPPQFGRLALSATAYGQTRVYYVTSAARDIQVFVQGGGDPKVALNAASTAPYATLNLRADWDNAGGRGVDVSVFVNNATNATYATGKVEPLNTFAFSDANYAPPRMFGFEVSRKF